MQPRSGSNSRTSSGPACSRFAAHTTRWPSCHPRSARVGVIASSAGNHAQGVALAGDLLDIDTTIVVPEVTPAAKIEATRGYGAEVVVEGDIYERSYEYALSGPRRPGKRSSIPSTTRDVVAGQGTIGLELLEQYPNIDTVLVAIGGGGLISGIGTVLKAAERDVRVIGVQPEGSRPREAVARFRRNPPAPGCRHRCGGDRGYATARDDVRNRPRGRRRRGQRERSGDRRRGHPAGRTREDGRRERRRCPCWPPRCRTTWTSRVSTSAS